jgi:hypothetical protein
VTRLRNFDYDGYKQAVYANTAEGRKERKRQNAVINRAKMWELKKRPCADCHLRWHPMCMTFDHIDRRVPFKNPAAKNISSVVSFQPDMFNRLLMNMSVVCLNCHRIRELKRDIDDPKMAQVNREEARQLLDMLTKGGLLPDSA